MSQPTVEQLRAVKLARKRELSTLCEAARKAKRTAGLAAEAKAREWVLVGPLRETALAVHVLADYAPEPVVVLLRGAGRERHWEEKGDEFLVRLVEDEFMNTSLEELCAIVDESSPTNLVALQRAVACVAQWQTVFWAMEQASTRRVAPDTERLALEYEAVRATFAESVRPRVWLGAAGMRKQGARLRERWNGRYGIMRPREILPVAVMLSKAVFQTIGHGARRLGK